MTTDPTINPAAGTTTSSAAGGTNLPARIYEDKTAMYKVAFEESVRALKDQVDELSTIRQRLVQFLAFVGSATAFLVGSSLQAVQATTRDSVFFGLAGVGTALMVGFIGFATYLLWPSRWTFGATSSAQTIIREMIERKIKPIRNDGEFYHDFAIYNDQAVDDNEKALTWARRVYFSGIFCGAAQLAVWIALIWLKV